MSRATWKEVPRNRRQYLLLNCNGEVTGMTHLDSAAAQWCHRGRGRSVRWIDIGRNRITLSPNGDYYRLWSIPPPLYIGVAPDQKDHTPTEDEP